jgi:hypothetical protein
VMGDYVFCSGQIGSNPETGALVQGSIQDRTVRISPRLKLPDSSPLNLSNDREHLLMHWTETNHVQPPRCSGICRNKLG